VPPAPSTQREPTADGRLGVLDQARIVAALGVIWIHTPETAQLQGTTVAARFAVPFFACAAGYFAATTPHLTLGPDLLRRCRQLYLKFLAWSLVYLATRWLAGALFGMVDDFQIQPLVDLLTGGPVYHLWFLPFAIVLSAVTTLIRFRPALSKGLTGTLLVLTTGALFLPRPPHGIPAAYLLALIRDHLPAGLVGVALALWKPQRMDLGAALRPVVWPAGALTLGCLVSQLCIGRQIVVEDLFGIAIFVCAVGARPRGGPTIFRLSKATLGVYLVHALFVEGLQDVLHGVLHLPVSTAFDLGLLGVATLASFAAVDVLLRFRATRWLVV